MTVSTGRHVEIRCCAEDAEPCDACEVQDATGEDYDREHSHP